MKYLISEIDDDACCEIPQCICNTRTDAEELILALTEEDVYNQAMYEGVDDFFCLSLWLMRMAKCYDLSFAVIPTQDFIPPMDIHVVIRLAFFGFGW